MKKYYSIKIEMSVDLEELFNVKSSYRKLAMVGITIQKANLDNAVFSPSSMDISIRKRKNSECCFMNLQEVQHRFWFGEVEELKNFYQKQKVKITEFHTDYLAFLKKMAVVNVNGVQPIEIMLFPEDVDFLYDPEKHSLPDYWQPRR